MTTKNNKPFLFWLAIAWLAIAFACVLLTALRFKPWPSLRLSVYAGWTTVLSLVAFVQYWRDKRTAQSNAHNDEKAQRVPERNLHALALLGGWPGAVIGQLWLRHKSQKMTFHVALALIAIAHVAGVAGYIWWTLK
ncbi:MAG: DUF1294 domain-containing protein [Pirellulaceae bacterium]